MTLELGKTVDLWEDDFDEMAETVHKYILDSLSMEDIEYAEIPDNRREIETGYTYSGKGLEFKFSLAGTFNSDPEILKNGKRKIVLQTEDENTAYRELIKDLERQRGSKIEEKQFGEIDIYELEVRPPYS